MGIGRLHEHVGTNGDDAARARYSGANGMPVANLTDVSYRTYTATAGGQAI